MTTVIKHNRERTMPGVTHCWGVVVPHIIYKGITLTPRIQREKYLNGYKAKNIDGIPFVETTPDGRIVYALPGGGAYIADPVK